MCRLNLIFSYHSGTVRACTTPAGKGQPDPRLPNFTGWVPGLGQEHGLQDGISAAASMVWFARHHPAPSTGHPQRREHSGTSGGLCKRTRATGRTDVGNPAPAFQKCLCALNTITSTYAEIKSKIQRRDLR